MKTRSELSAAEVVDLQAEIDHKLDMVGVPSRPEVALRLLELSSSTMSEMKDFAGVIRMDHAMSGRVLKLANSVLFAQRTPVTNLDRACLVLGLERIKSLSLGLQLSRAAASSSDRDVSREVWGQSVFRACLAAEVAKCIAPSFVPEAFVVGLMLDAGIPIMCRLAGDEFSRLFEEARTPGSLFRKESESLEFTHVDIVAALARRWRFPELLLRPIEWHHTRPADLRRPEPIHRLHRIAYVVGMVELDPETMMNSNTAQVRGQETAVTAQRLLGIPDSDVQSILSRTMCEYTATIDLFSEVALGLGNLDAILERVQTDMVRAVDGQVEHSLIEEETNTPLRVLVAGQSVEVRRADDGAMVAYLYDSQGARLLAHRFNQGEISVQSLCDAFGLEVGDAAERERLMDFVARQAA